MSEPQVRSGWPLYEVFLRGKRGLNHVHVGSLHAADPDMALHHARDLYTRRNEGVSIWVVAASDITASSPDEKDPFFAPSGTDASTPSSGSVKPVPNAQRWSSVSCARLW